jgi:DNA-binding NarL/FixJ family response regulator
MTTILLAENQHLVRAALRHVFAAEDDFTVVGETADGLLVRQLVKQLQPDVLITNVMLPGLCGLEITRQVTQQTPHTHVVIFTRHAVTDYVVQAFRNGAAAYVVKTATAAMLMHAVREVVAGRRYLSPCLSEHALDAPGNEPTASAADPLAPLTTREREVFFLVMEGHTNLEIGTRLGISARTAELHRSRLLHKLGLHRQTDLVRYAIRQGIILLEP